jgi:aspartyl-tRNA(Asn)/glutamyl-tRNA(Gln) amidotransferase subunit A
MTASLYRSAAAIRDDVLEGRTSVVDVVGETFRRIAALEPRLQAFLSLDQEGALERAKELDKRVRKKQAEGRLFGVPVAVKDNICVAGRVATCGSRILEGFVPPYHAHVVDRLLAEGAVLVGKTNLDEFGMGSSTENSAFRPTRNPHDTTRVPGGSSGGSAAAVASAMVPLALGSDTGGSIRQPASMCGVVGFKPTYGTVSRYGLIAYASSLDQIGPLAGSVLDAATLAAVVAGHDPRDSTSIEFEQRDYAASLTRDLDGVRIGVHKDHVDDLQDDEVKGLIRKGIDALRDAGARIVRLDDIDLLSRFAIATYYLVATSEASSNLARFDGMRYGPREAAASLAEAYTATRGGRFGDEVALRILLGTFALSKGYADAYYKKALQVRRLIRAAYEAAFAKVDLIAGATSPIPAFPIGERVSDPLTMYQVDALTVPPSLAGLPAASVPCGATAAGLPVGLQIVGPPLEDAKVLSAAFAFEQRSGLKGHVPALTTELLA